MTTKSIFPSISIFGRTTAHIKKIDEIDGVSNTLHSIREISELDVAVHVKCDQSLPPEKNNTIDDTKHVPLTKTNSLQTTRSMPPSDRYNFWKFEQKYTAFVAAADGASASALVDDIYHDQVVHMMDGVAMNKSALAKFYVFMLNEGTKRTLKEFIVIDDSRVKTVIHSRNQQNMEYDYQVLITLKDGKIIRVEKFENATPRATPTRKIKRKSTPKIKSAKAA